MITFRISFLLAFYLAPPVLEEEKSERAKKGNKSPKRGRKSDKSDNSSKSKSKSKEKSKLVEEASSSKPEYVLETGNPIGYAHIEYELIPDRPKQVIDVICWNKIAKVFVGAETVAFKCKIVDEMIWVPVFVQHCINTLETKALIEFYNHPITFVIFTNKQELSVRAKFEEISKQFFIRQDDLSADDIAVIAYTEDPNIGASNVNEKGTTLEDAMRDIITDCIYKPGIKNKEEILTLLKLNDEVHTFEMNEIIMKNSNGKYTCLRKYVPVSLPPDSEDEKTEEDDEKVKDRKANSGKEKKNPRNKKEKKQSKAKPKLGGPLQIKVNSEVFFTNPKFSVFDLKQSNNAISKAFVLLSVDHLMTMKQKYELNPLVIRINEIRNLPADVLRSHNFRSVFLRYNVPHVAQTKTMEKNIDDQVVINEAHAHFTNEIPNARFSEFMTAERLCVEICGVLDDSSRNTEGNLFDGELVWKKLTPRDYSTIKSGKPRVVVLAVACYDLSFLITSTWDFLLNESCHNPDNILFQKSANPYARRKLVRTTPANINFTVSCKKRSGSPLTEVILTECNTCLKLEVFLVVPAVHVKCDVIASTCFYARMFLTLYDRSLAMSLLNDLLLRNQYLNKDIVTKSSIQRSVKEDELVKSEWITGFVIDNIEEFSFFIEGLECNIVQFWKDFSDHIGDKLKVFYNGATKFEKRLYADLLAISGVYVITLQRPLRDILALPGIYLEGNVPIPCWRALRKLDLLYRCRISKDMLQFSLFPTCDELCSLDLEFGVPLYWKQPVRRRVRRGTLVDGFN